MSTSLSTSATQMLNLHYAILGSQPTLTQLNAYAGTYKKAQTAGATADGALDAVATVILDSDAAINALMPNLAAPKTLATKLLANVGITNAAIVDFIAGFLDGTSNGGKPFPLSTAAVVISNYVASYKTGTSAYTAWDADLVAAQKVHSARAVPEPTGQTFTLTAGTDTVAGSSVADTINAALTATGAMTYSSADNIDGGMGVDSLYVEVAGSITDDAPSALSLALVKSVEKVTVSNRIDNDGVNVTLPTDKAAVSLVNSGSTFAVNFTSVASAATTLELNGVNAAAAVAAVTGPPAVDATAAGFTTIGYASTALAGAADELKISLSSASGPAATGATIVVGGGSATNALETVSVNTAAESTVSLDFTSAGVKTLNLAGAGKLTVKAITDGGTVKTIDASTATGAVSVPAPSAVNVTITGGGGNDTLVGGTGNDVIKGGAGADSITAGAGNDSVDAGAGNDTVVLSGTITADDTITGGDGVDTLSMAAAIVPAVNSTTFAVTTNTAANVSGFEAITVTAGAVDQRMDILAANNPITKVTIGTTGASFTGRGVSGVTDVAVGASAAAVTGASVALGALKDGTADALAISLGTAAGGNGGLTLAAPWVETLTVTSNNATASSLTLSTTTTDNLSSTLDDVSKATSLTSITASGKGLGITGSGLDKSLATVDASGVTGVFTLTNTGSTVAMTVKGGTGGGTVNTGTGSDTVDFSAIVDTTKTANVTLGLGNDSAIGGAGDDTIDGGSGNDVLLGGGGADSLVGGSGNDQLEGGAGNDTLDVGAGADTVYGGDGDDAITVASLSAGDVIDGGANNDTLTISSAMTDDTVLSIKDVETITGLAMNASALSTSATDFFTADFTGVTGASKLTVALTENTGTVLDYFELKGLAAPTITLSDTAGAGGVGGGYLLKASGSGAFKGTLTGVDTGDISGAATGSKAVNLSGFSAVTLTAAHSSAGGTTLGTATIKDATALTLSTSTATGTTALTAVSGTQYTTGAIGASVLTSLTETSSAYHTVNYGLVTASDSLGTVTMTSGTGSAFTSGGVTATNAVLSKVALTAGESSTTAFGLITGAASIDALTIDVGYNAGGTTGTVTASSITDATVTLYTGSSATLTVGGGVLSNLAVKGRTAGTVDISVAPSTTSSTVSASAIEGNTAVILRGNTGADKLTGGSGADFLIGGGGSDSLVGGAGIDNITGGVGAETIDGGAGIDVITLNATASEGIDVIKLATSAANRDTIANFATQDVLWLPSGTSNNVAHGAGAAVAGDIVAVQAGNYAAAAGKFIHVVSANVTGAASTDGASLLTAIGGGVAATVTAANAADVIFFAVDDGANTYIYRGAASGVTADTAITANEIALVATLTGVADAAAALTFANFTFGA